MSAGKRGPLPAVIMATPQLPRHRLDPHLPLLLLCAARAIQTPALWAIVLDSPRRAKSAALLLCRYNTLTMEAAGNHFAQLLHHSAVHGTI